ncbi:MULTISPECIES: HNH endonuclease [Burkholderia]|nr:MULTISPECIES: HNH endonuclease [Burkholderia]
MILDTTEMTLCIYCRKPKSKGDLTLEHVIPQFLGGACVPDEFKTRSVCKSCNNDLGLFVDASFEKHWFVTEKLREIHYSTFDPSQEVGLPLICMGHSDLRPPMMEEGETCEAWLGPLGEQIYWVRKDDSRLYWYSGGNPRTVKKAASRAYYLFSERSPKNPALSLRAFRDSFAGRRVRKIMCTTVDFDPKVIGFSDPDELDKTRIDYILRNCLTKPRRRNRVRMYVHYDVRFMAKLAIGMAHCLFGERVLSTTYANMLHKGLWHRPDEDVPELQGATDWMKPRDPHFAKVMGDPDAVTIAIVPVANAVAVNLNLGESMNWSIQCASGESLAPEDIEALGMGRVIVLYPQLHRSVDLPMVDYIAHKIGNRPHPKLTEIGAMLNRNRDYLKSL